MQSSSPCMIFWWEGVNHFAVFVGDYFIISSRIQYFSGNFVVSHHGGGLSYDQKLGYPGVDPRSDQHVHLTFLYHIHDVAYCGNS